MFRLAFLLIAASSAPEHGTLTFPVTGNAGCNANFQKGMLALHSFSYDEAHGAFQAAADADPRCAMAHWGDAMAWMHVLWENEDLQAAQAALAAAGDESKLSQKERDYLTAARALTGKGNTAEREQRWLRAAEAMHRTYPGDDEVALQDALALLTNSDDGRNVRRSMEAAALAQEVFAHNPRHPGAAHYLIHAFDSPDHAVLGLPAARSYAALAPSTVHALHMPSHIFVQLGMWPEVLASNSAAWEVNGADAKRNHTEGDRDWHTRRWMLAAQLELGQLHSAERTLQEVQAQLHAKDSAELRLTYVAMVWAYLSHVDGWSRLPELLAPLAQPLAPNPSVSASMLQLDLIGVRAEAALWQGDRVGVAQAFEPLAATFTELEQRKPQEKLEQQWRSLRTAYLAGALALHAPSSQRDAAIAEAIADFDAVVETPSGPAFAPPPREVAGKLLLSLGRPQAALTEFEASLEEHPNRAPSLLGAARAAKGAGDAATAQRYYAELATLWANADADLPAFAEAHAQH